MAIHTTKMATDAIQGLASQLIMKLPAGAGHCQRRTAMTATNASMRLLYYAWRPPLPARCRAYQHAFRSTRTTEGVAGCRGAHHCAAWKLVIGRRFARTR